MESLPHVAGEGHGDGCGLQSQARDLGLRLLSSRSGI
jgi:hypothetical protein